MLVCLSVYLFACAHENDIAHSRPTSWAPASASSLAGRRHTLALLDDLCRCLLLFARKLRSASRSRSAELLKSLLPPDTLRREAHGSLLLLLFCLDFVMLFAR